MVLVAHDQNWKMRQLGPCAEPPYAIDRAVLDPHGLPATFGNDRLQQRSVGVAPADQRVRLRVTRQHGAAAIEQRDRRALSERDGREELLVTLGIDPAHHDAEQFARGVRQPACDHGGPFADQKAAHGLQQHRLGPGVGLEGLEIGAGRDIDLRQRLVSRPVDDVAVGVVDRDVPEIVHGADLVREHATRFCARHALVEHLGRGDLRQVHLRDHIGGDGLGIFELLVEMPGQQQDCIFQLALAIDERVLAKLTDGHDGRGKDAGDEQRAAQGQPQHGATPRGCIPAVLGG